MLKITSCYLLAGLFIASPLYASELVEEEVPEVEEEVASEENPSKTPIAPNSIAEEDSSAGFLTEGFVLQGLDKVTARTFEITGTLNQSYDHKTLTVYVRKCWKPGPDENPDAIAYIDVFEQKIDMKPVQIFSGWMFASEHAVSALEHPVYDVWIKACSGKETPYRAIRNEQLGEAATVPLPPAQNQQEMIYQDEVRNDVSETPHQPSDRMKALYRGLNIERQSNDDAHLESKKIKNNDD